MATKGFWGAGAIDTPPDLTTLNSEGYPTSGDPAKGIPATTPRAAWFYITDQARLSVITAAGLTPKASETQFLEALQSVAWVKNNSIPASKLAKSQDLGDHELMIRGMPLAQLQKITLKNRELAVATDTYDLYVGDGVTAGGHLVGGSKYDEITEVLAKLTNAVATLGHQAQPLSGV